MIDPPAVIAEGLETRDFIVDAITLGPGVAPGDFVFVSELPSYTADFSGHIEVVCTLDGAPVARTSYEWHEGTPHTFVFPGLFTIDLESNAGGNMYYLHDSLFEGRSVLRVVCD